MATGIRLLRAGAVSLGPLVTHRFSLDDIGAAFETARAKPPGYAKAVVLLGDS
jgi:threonine dehydrogenase-like Zn-dependent dehydrogenase